MNIGVGHYSLRGTGGLPRVAVPVGAECPAVREIGVHMGAADLGTLGVGQPGPSFGQANRNRATINRPSLLFRESICFQGPAISAP